MNQILANLQQHWQIYSAAGTALFVAGVCTMPQKMPMVRADRSIQEVWTWVRDSLQTAVPAARASHLNANPTQEAPKPPQPK